MRTLVVSEQGAEVSVQGESLVLSVGGKEARRVQFQELGLVVAMGSVELTSGARRELLRRGVDVVFLSAAGRYWGRLVGRGSGNGARRVAQYRFVEDAEARRRVAARIVRAKILNQRKVLLRVQRELRSEEVGEALAAMRLAAERATELKDLDELRGLEGSAAAAYWRGFRLAVRHPELAFRGRTHRPPGDEVNALLSFGYTFLGVVQESHVLAAGLDPCLGCFHEVDYNRPSLALDLIEEFRPVAVDALVLAMVNRRQFGRRDFMRPEEVRRAEAILEGRLEGEGEPKAAGEASGEGGVYLAEGARRVFLRAFFDRLRERMARSGEEGEGRELREVMKEQVYGMVRVMEGRGEDYESFVWR